jgi:hypothetical protein
MTDRPWFRARESGLGWTPIAWEGWLITLASAAVVAGANAGVVIYLLGAHR